MIEKKPFSLVKPTIQTPFHIDFDWWQQNDRNWRIYLRSLLCQEHQEAFTEWKDGQTIDWIDPDTAEVTSVDGMQHILMTHCTHQMDFLNEHTALVEAVFRLFLINGNNPMMAIDLESRLHRPAGIILRTLAGPRIYKGIRPCSK